MIRRLGSMVVVVALASAAAAWLAPPPSIAASSRCPLPVFGPGSQYHPKINPRNFGPNVDNPLFPLQPGRTFVYAGVKDGQNAIDIFAPSSRTKRIDGVTTRVVEDRLYLDGVLEERTSDYYAQDRCGNVWYFGEDTAELDENGADEGSSFPSEFLPRAFGRFSRADPTGASGGGAGLGLSIVAAIARRHGGAARAVNRPGGGADVSISLPCDAATTAVPRQ